MPLVPTTKPLATNRDVARRASTGSSCTSPLVPSTIALERVASGRRRLQLRNPEVWRVVVPDTADAIDDPVELAGRVQRAGNALDCAEVGIELKRPLTGVSLGSSRSTARSCRLVSMRPSGTGLVSDAVNRDGVRSVRSRISSEKMSKMRGSFSGLRGKMLSLAFVAVSLAMANLEPIGRSSHRSWWLGRARHVAAAPRRNRHLEPVERYRVQLRQEDAPPRRIAAENWRMLTSGGDPAVDDGGGSARRPKRRDEATSALRKSRV